MLRTIKLLLAVVAGSILLTACGGMPTSGPPTYRYPESLPEAPPLPGNQNPVANVWNIGFSPESIGVYMDITSQVLLSGITGQDVNSKSVSRNVTRAYNKSASAIRKDQKTAQKAYERQYKTYLKNSPKVACFNGNSYKKAAEMIRGPDGKLYVGYYYDETGSCKQTETSYGRAAPAGIPNWQHRQQVQMPDGKTLMVVPAGAVTVR